MAIDNEILAELKALRNDMAKNSSKLFANAGADKNSIRDDSARKLETSVKKAEQTAKGMTDATDLLPRNLKKAFNESGSSFVKSMAQQVKGFEDVLKTKDQITTLKAISAEIGKLKDVKAADPAPSTEVGKLKEVKAADLSAFNDNLDVMAKRVGLTIGTLNASELDQRASDLEDAMKSAEKATNKTVVANQKATQTVARLRSGMERFGAMLAQSVKASALVMEQEQRLAQQTATADAGWIRGVMDMGITQIQYMNLLKDSRIESLAAATAGVDFTKTLIASKTSLEGLTANFEEASKVAVMNYKNMARMGVSQDDLGDAVLQQTKIYKENYRALGFTAEQFANLTSDLLNDQGMRDVLLTLKEKERKSYVLGIQQRMAEYQTMGFTIERAKALQKTFQGLVGMDPKERMKKAAKKRAMLGSIGMGAEAEELFKLETTYRTLNAEQKKDADMRMAQIQSKASQKFGEMSGSGVSLGQSMAMQMMAQKTGFNEVVQTFETESGRGMKIDQALLSDTNEINTTVSKMLGWMSNFRAFMESGLTGLGGMIIKGLGAILIGGYAKDIIGGFAGKAASKAVSSGVIGKLFNAGAGAGALVKMVAGPAVGVAMAGAAGYGIGTIINGMLGDGVKETIGSIIGPMFDGIGSLFGLIDEKPKGEIRAIAENPEYGKNNMGTSEKTQFDQNTVLANDLQKKFADDKISREEFMKQMKRLNEERNEVVNAVTQSTAASTLAVRSNFKSRR